LLLRLLEICELLKGIEKGVRGLLIKELSCLRLLVLHLKRLGCKVIHKLSEHVVWLENVIQLLLDLVLIVR